MFQKSRDLTEFIVAALIFLQPATMFLNGSSLKLEYIYKICFYLLSDAGDK